MEMAATLCTPSDPECKPAVRLVESDAHRADRLDAGRGGICRNLTPASLGAALEMPITLNLHDVIIPGFVLHWDFDALVKSLTFGEIIRCDPTDWLPTIAPRLDAILL